MRAVAPRQLVKIHIAKSTRRNRRKPITESGSMHTTFLKSLLTAALLLCVFGSNGQSKPYIVLNETPEQKAKRMQWWTDARFGMFIHWGIYALPARHDWTKSVEQMSDAEYGRYFDVFDPDLFDARQWAKQAKAAGMKYAVLTTKHHDGFCLFDSKFTDYDAVNTPAKRDLVKEFVEAFRAEGLRVGFYYSLIDWHHPDFTIDRFHPQRPAALANEQFARLNKDRHMDRYRTYVYNQVTELLTNYGKIDILWADFTYPLEHGKTNKDWDAVNLVKLVRKLQPEILLDNRLGLGAYADGEDFLTPEQPTAGELERYKGKTWETCQTFSGSWGYNRDESSWKTQRELLGLLINSVSYGGNILLNVGPTARGDFDHRATHALDSIGYWMRAHNKSIYKCTTAPEAFQFSTNEKLAVEASRALANQRLTYNPETKRLYLHLFDYPKGGRITLPGYKGKVKYAQFLHDNSEIQMNELGEKLWLTVPPLKPPYEIPVIELVLY